MSRLFLRLAIFMSLFVCVVCTLAFSIPADKNNYLYEYNYKIDLMQATPSPRIVLIGGSSVAFGTDSQTLKDSLNFNVINLGLDAGIGTKFPIEDCLQYIERGDIAVFQFEYENFYNGGEGDLDNFPSIMHSTEWRSPNLWTYNQWVNVILGLPKIAMSNLFRIAKYPFTKSWNIVETGEGFKYKRDGFNEYGDEISHFKYPSLPVNQVNYIIKQKGGGHKVDRRHIDWINEVIKKYEHKGAKVIMLPPVCIKTQFYNSYNNDISKALEEIGHPYEVAPQVMALDDSLVFDRGYHVTIDGVRKNTENILNCLRKVINTSKSHN